MPRFALGIDIGTGSSKAALVDGDGRVLSVGRCPHPVAAPRPGWSETDPGRWLDSVEKAVVDAVDSAPPETTVVAIGLSGQMHGVVACDEGGEPVRPAVLWSDRRSQNLLGPLRDALGAEVVSRLANPIVAGMAGPTLTALVRDEPSVMNRVGVVLQPKDWVRHRLTGSVATDPSDASATLLWDAVDGNWSAGAAAGFGVPTEWLAPVASPGSVAGALTAGMAGSLGLPEGLPVAVGGADTACALLGAGLSSGEVQVTTGTGGQIARLTTERPEADPAPVIHRYRSVQPSARWYEMAAIQNAGIAIDWACGLLGVAVADAGDLVAESPVGAGGVSFLPYLTGERTPHLDSGLTGCWAGVRASTTRADLVRAVFEGVAFALRDGLDALVGDERPGYALLAGGGSTAAWWRQMLADALAIPLVPHDVADASVRGAALLAWSSVGQPVDPSLAVTRLAAVEPDPGTVDRYAAARGRFLAALPAVGR